MLGVEIDVVDEVFAVVSEFQSDMSDEAMHSDASETSDMSEVSKISTISVLSTQSEKPRVKLRLELQTLFSLEKGKKNYRRNVCFHASSFAVMDLPRSGWLWIRPPPPPKLSD